MRGGEGEGGGGSALAHNWTSKLDRRGENVLVPDAIKQQLNGCAPFTPRSVRTLSFNKNIIGREMRIAQGGTKFYLRVSACLQGGTQIHRSQRAGCCARAHVFVCIWVLIKAAAALLFVQPRDSVLSTSASWIRLSTKTRGRRGEEEWTSPRCSSACNDKKIEAKAENNTERTSSQGWKYKIRYQSVVKSPFSLWRPLSPPQDSITIHFINASLTLIMLSLNWSLWVFGPSFRQKTGHSTGALFVSLSK